MRLKTYFKKRGNQAKMAKDLGVSRQYIGQLYHSHRPLPDHIRSNIETLTGGLVKAHELPR